MSIGANVDMASLTGHGFSNSEKAAVMTSATILLKESKYGRVKVWGKVFGFKADYIIVSCIGSDVFSKSTTFFSTDCGVSYNVLEPIALDDPRCKYYRELKGQYMGDPAYEYRLTDSVTGNAVSVKESERLAYFQSLHDYHCRVIPRGAQLQHEDGSIRVNATFEGLDRTAAGRLASYVHLRKEKQPETLLEAEGVDSHVDFLDPLTVDVPVSVWTLKYDAMLDVVYGSNLMFDGAVFYHKPETQLFGNVYLGDGCVNHDCAFML